KENPTNHATESRLQFLKTTSFAAGALLLSPQANSAQPESIEQNSSSGATPSYVDFVADNPGLTLFHCHQQLHMDFGFMTLFDYA
ncbi:MAG: multicopper oxidase domain-containing protein, partial [Candidatus Acidiferrum sp.]